MQFEEKLDVIEEDIAQYSRELLDILLKDRTTNENIIWATSDYTAHGELYAATEQIYANLITGVYSKLIQPRVAKAHEQKNSRTRDKAEVFTPSWICNAQNNLVDEHWFGRPNVFNIPQDSTWTATERIVFPDDKQHTWKQYVDARRIEISCGEAPYLVSRYDTVTGEPIDLIKNKIFEVLNKVEPADFAEETWKEIKEILSSGKESVGFATFYQHFWSSKYKKVYSNKLYEAFNATIKKNEAEYSAFLNELLRNAKIYMQIVNPKREDYDNRKEYFGVVQSLNCINNYFNVVQVRIALLALFDVKQREIIDLTMLRSTLSYLENFHFAYNAILANRTNRLEKIYSSFAIALRKASTKVAARGIIQNELIAPLDELFPTFENFSAKFVALSFTKKDKASNVKTKYAINKLNSFYSETEVFSDDGSIEHIISEREGGDALNIGNLILLEGKLNDEAGHKDYSDKCAAYAKSNYAWVKNFIAKHRQWDSSMITQRAIELSKVYYSQILKRELPAVPEG